MIKYLTNNSSYIVKSLMKNLMNILNIQKVNKILVFMIFFLKKTTYPMIN